MPNEVNSFLEDSSIPLAESEMTYPLCPPFTVERVRDIGVPEWDTMNAFFIYYSTVCT